MDFLQGLIILLQINWTMIIGTGNITIFEMMYMQQLLFHW